MLKNKISDNKTNYRMTERMTDRMTGACRAILCAVLAAGALVTDGNGVPGAYALDATDIQPEEVTVSIKSAEVPIGTIIAWPVGLNPDNAASWLECNGQSITSAQYPKLTAVLGGTGATSAVIPDLRGLFLRGYGQQSHSQNNGTATGVTATTHKSGSLLTVQGDAMRLLYGTLPVGGTTTMGNTVNAALSGTFSYNRSKETAGFASAPSKAAVQAFFSSQRTVPTDTEIRPANMAVRYLIRAL